MDIMWLLMDYPFVVEEEDIVIEIKKNINLVYILVYLSLFLTCNLDLKLE